MSAVQFLLENGADVNTKDKKGFTLLMYCVQLNDMSLIKLVLSYGANIVSQDKSGFTALDYAVKNNNLEVIKLLCNNGAIVYDHSYMLSIDNHFRCISNYFDSLDQDKQIFLKKGYCV